MTRNSARSDRLSTFESLNCTNYDHLSLPVFCKIQYRNKYLTPVKGKS